MGIYKVCGNPSCRLQNAPDAKFCIKCGNKLEDPVLQVQLSESSAETTEMATQSFKTIATNRNKKVGIIAIVTILMLCIGGFIGGKMMYSPDRLVNSLVQAAKANNVGDFYEHISIAKDVNYDEHIYKEHLKEVGLKSLAKQVEAKIKALKESSSKTEIVYNELYGVPEFEITKGKKFGIFPSYELTAYAHEVTAIINSDRVELTLLKQSKTLKEESTELGKYLASNYTYSIKAKLESGEVTYEREMYVGRDNYNEINAAIETYSIKLSSDYPQAFVVIDGQNTNKTIEETPIIEQIPLEQKMVISAFIKEDGKQYESEAYEVSYADSLYFTFPEYEKVQIVKNIGDEEIQKLLNDYRYAYEDAIVQADFSYVSDYFVQGTKLFTEYKKFVNDHSKLNDYHYSFNDPTIKTIEISEDGYIVATTFETFVFSSKDGSYLYERNKKYHFVFDEEEEKYLIDNIEILDTKKTKQ